jgi:hypothetical protein
MVKSIPMLKRALWILLLAWPALADAAAALAIATIVDGSPTMVRASSKLALGEGTRLAAEDIVETGAARHAHSGRSAAQAPATGTTGAPALPARLVEHATRVLTSHMGPIARIVVKKASARALTRDEFFRLLGEEAGAAVDRARLLADLEREH